VKKENTIEVLRKLGELFRALGNEQPWSGFEIGLTKEEYDNLAGLTGKVHIYNPWFTKPSVLYALRSLGEMLSDESLLPFAARYGSTEQPKRVMIIMAGNIPLVGFHDLMCVLLSGHTAVCKLSSNDAHLLPALIQVLGQWDPELVQRIEWTAGQVKALDAVIATGSDNSANYFEQYFGKYPHIFRRNRTSVAVLTGEETPEELIRLGNDMFRYFGLGCRNVSKIFVPDTFNLDRIFEAIVGQGEIVNHHKYANNYDYNRTVYMMNSIPFLDNNFCILKEDEGLFSPLSVFFVQRYRAMDEVEQFVADHKNDIQTIVGAGYQPLGAAQQPAIDDYADGIDTMEWLVGL
jgi:hypothetical protein